MSFFAASPFLKTLGWALVNSVWQFAICWLLYYIITSSARNLAAAVRHTLALFLLFLGTLFFIIELSSTWYAEPALTGSRLVIENTSWYSSWHSTGDYMNALMPYWSLLYLVCIVLLFIKLCFFVRHAGNLRHNGITKMSAAWRMYIKNISAQLGIQKEVKALLSVHIDTPQVIGFLKPVILIPAACLVNLSTEQLEAVLLHELVHIKRNDYLVNLFVASAEILFFFNPFVKQITANIRKEREYSCDDMVIQFQYHPRNYASALLMLERNRLIPVTYGIAASGKDQKQLLTRIERIIGIKNKQTGFYQAGAGLVALLLLGFIAGMHPKTGVDGFDPPAIGFAYNNGITGLPYNGEASTRFTAAHTLVLRADKEDNTAKKTSPPATIARKTNDQENIQHVVLAAVASSEEDEEESNHVLNAASKEAMDFSLPQQEPVDVPETMDIPATTKEPYVPASSFSFQLTQDTTIPKIKGETYNERKAREAMIKTQKALAAINWQKIEKDLKYNSRDLVKLKKEITLQLQNVNWQKINVDVQNELGQQQFEKLQEAVKQNQVIKLYQQNEVYNEALQKHLILQEQVIKESDERLQENQKAVDQQQKKLLLEMKKRRIIYI